MNTPVVIIGGGIGGLSAAVALCDAGLEVTLYERASALTEVGAGLQITPNAGRALKTLGITLDESCGAVAIEAHDVCAGRSGRVVATMPVKAMSQSLWGEPWFTIHRDDLLKRLLGAVGERKGITLRLDHPIDKVITEKHGYRLTSLRADDADIAAQIVIGADGLWSRARRSLGDVALPRPSLKTAWRATLPPDALPERFRAPRGGLWLGPDSHLVHYPIRGGKLLNMVAIIGDDWDGEGWSTPGDAAQLQRAFAGWCADVRGLLAQARGWMRWPLVDRPAWYGPGAGTATLLGDAAHPMVPFLAQGAASAIEDAVVLGKEVAATPTDMAGAMRRYEQARIGRVRRIQEQARQNGRIYHLTGLTGFGRDMVIKSRGGEQMLKSYDWIYGWKP